MMKKLFLVTFAMLLFSVLANGQIKRGYIYLKSGTILKGKVLPGTEPGKVRVESAGNTWVFDASEVDTVTSARMTNVNRTLDERNYRFSNLTELGLLVGNSNNSQNAPFSFNSFLNYRFTKLMNAGLGTGVEFLKETYIPALVNLQFRFRDMRATPFLFFEGGYQIPVEDSRQYYYDVVSPSSSRNAIYPYEVKARGGLLINPGLGYIQMISPNFGMSFSFGYRFNRLNYSGENDYQLDIDYNRLSVKVGFLFN